MNPVESIRGGVSSGRTPSCRCCVGRNEEEGKKNDADTPASVRVRVLRDPNERRCLPNAGNEQQQRLSE